MKLNSTSKVIAVAPLVSDCEGCSRGLVVPLEVFDNATGRTILLMPGTPAINRGEIDD